MSINILRKRQFLLLHLPLFLLLILPLVVLISQQKEPNIQRAKAAIAPTLGSCQVFSSDNVWNYDISSLSLHPNSANYISYYSTDKLNAYFSSGGGYAGFPYAVVPSTQRAVPITFTKYASESDPGPYPISTNAPIEDPNSSGSDRHVLVVDSGSCKLYEMAGSYPQADGSWNAYNGAVFDLTSDNLRPNGWTSTDAAGLPILPGLVRYDEVAAGQINHALRFLLPYAQNTYLWPARHTDGQLTDTNAPPEGLRLRLKASVNISTYPPQSKVILQALKQYGMFLADQYGNPAAGLVEVAGAPDSRWNMTDLASLGNLHFSDFEAVDESGIQVSPDSAQVAGAATPTPTLTPMPTPTPTLTPTSQPGGISLRAAATGTNSAGGSTVTITKPAGTLSGDVMVAHVVVRTAGNTITPPAGWKLVLRQDSGSSISTASYVKVAGSAEPASYTWSFGTADEASGGIASYSGVNTTTPVDASHAQYNRLSSNDDNTGVTTTTANDLLVYAVGITVATTVNAPAGFTQEWSTTSHSSTTSEMSQEIFSSIGATGTLHGTHNGGANSNITLLIALKPAGVAATATPTPTSTPTPTLTPMLTPTLTPTSQPGGISLRAAATGTNSAGGSTVTITKPAGTLSGDVMVAHVVVRTAGNTITPPAGWHLVLRQDSGWSISTASYVKVAGSAEPASYTWSFGTADEASGGIASYSGVNTTTPVDASHAQYNRLSSNDDNTGVTTTTANDLLVYAVGITVATTVNDPAGFTQEWSTTSHSSTTSEMSQEPFPTIGATGTLHGTHNGGANSNITLLIALKPK